MFYSDPEIVRFNNGKYAIRRTFLGVLFQYKDLSSVNYWWPKNSRFIDDCCCDETEVKRWMTILTNRKFVEMTKKLENKDVGIPVHRSKGDANV